MNYSTAEGHGIAVPNIKKTWQRDREFTDSDQKRTRKSRDRDSGGDSRQTKYHLFEQKFILSLKSS
jgi:hypothetical protein